MTERPVVTPAKKVLRVVPFPLLVIRFSYWPASLTVKH